MTADDAQVIAALTALRDVGLVVDRQHLNNAWGELLGRVPATSGTRCQRALCEAPGRPYVEPAGTWCPDHRPVLWRVPESRWATPRCVHCGAPGAWPHQSTRATCRAHAPTRIARYLNRRPS